jgi:hypothetical protein
MIILFVDPIVLVNYTNSRYNLFVLILEKYIVSVGRLQSQRCLRHELSSLAGTLGSWVRIPLKAWMFAYAFILCAGSGLSTG